MTVAASLVLAGMALAAVMTCAWSVQRSTGNSGWIDVFWTFGTGAVACFLALERDEIWLNRLGIPPASFF